MSDTLRIMPEKSGPPAVRTASRRRSVPGASMSTNIIRMRIMTRPAKTVASVPKVLPSMEPMRDITSCWVA